MHGGQGRTTRLVGLGCGGVPVGSNARLNKYLAGKSERLATRPMQALLIQVLPSPELALVVPTHCACRGTRTTIDGTIT